MDSPKILVVDIETAPAEMWGWGLYNQNFGISQIKKHPYILCIGAKWVGDDEGFMFTKWEHGERGMLRGALKLIKEADAVVHKNGTTFDIPWIRLELLRMKMPPLPPITHIDLQKAAKTYFRFLSNKLEYIGQYLGEGGKHKTDFDLWKECMAGDEKARKKMVEYCARDIRLTERIYHRFRPFMENHPALRAVGAEACTKCGSKNTKKDGFRYTKCFKIQTHQCNNPACRGYFSGKRTKVA